jgi:hypothetical protein
MPNLYFIIYNHPSEEYLRNITIDNEVTRNFLNSYGDWYYDIGDDPSFYCSNSFGTNLSWGICRPDIRNNIQPNDVVVFFCYCGTNRTYFLTGIATVLEKITQTQIWTCIDYSAYKNHFNLLIRLNDGGWVHYEPLFNERGKHKNWAKRLVFDFPTDNFQSIDNSLLLYYSIRDNYVLFKKNKKDTYILKQPIHIANWTKGKKQETWLDTDDLKKMKKMIFKGTTRKSLRVHTNNQAHVHIKIEKNEIELLLWKNNFINFLESINN